MNEGTDNRTVPVGVGDLAAAEHLGKAMDRIMFEAGPGLRAYLADPPGYSHGRDELDERGCDAGQLHLAVPFGLTLLTVLWLAAGLVMAIGGVR